VKREAILKAVIVARRARLRGAQFRWGRAGRALALAFVAAGLVAAALPQSGAAAIERAPTDRFLRAELKLLQGVLASIPASVTAVRQTAAQIETVCPNVLAQSPAASVLAANAPVTKPLFSQAEQLKKLEDELSRIVEEVSNRSEQNPLSGLLSAFRELHWRDRLLARATYVSIRQLEHQLATPPRALPDACADMHSWVSSGYSTLSNATLAFLAPEHELGLRAPSLPKLVRALVAKRGDRLERALVRRSLEVARRLEQALEPFTKISQGLDTAVGLGAGDFGIGPEEVLIGRGTTAAGTTFVAKVTPSIKLCLPRVEITETAGPLISSFGGSVCAIATGAPPAEQSVRCAVGLLRVQARMLPTAKSAELLLSDGRKLDSPVLAMPAGVAGAPGGFYFQAVRGPSPTPVSLTELDVGGQPLTTLALPPVQRCALP
jgi:hypothetical protein